MTATLLALATSLGLSAGFVCGCYFATFLYRTDRARWHARAVAVLGRYRRPGGFGSGDGGTGAAVAAVDARRM